VYVGTPGERRKLIVHLIDAKSHSCELIVKVPLTEDAKLAIEHEAHALLELHDDGFSAAPRLVAFDQQAGIASQSVVRGALAGLHITREVAVLLQSLERRGRSIELRDVALSLEKDLSQLAMSPASAALVSHALEQINDSEGLPAVRTHGDFAPWNIKLQPGAAALVDWEDSQPHGLPLHDAYHFVHLTRCLFGKRPRPAWQDLRFRYPFTLSSSLRWKLELAYLLRTLVHEMGKSERRYAAFILATLRAAIESHP
jgi:aminoglycoside phosphotransferase (APT) family kinase protein